MKILVFSDSHGELDYMRRAVELERPERVFHLGDVARDAQRLSAEFPQIELDAVRGNCDWDGEGPEEKEVLLGGRRFWLLHGHTYRVKLGLGLLTAEARARGVDVALFGHTHQPVCFREGSVWVLNPGSCRGYPAPTCGVIELENGELRCRTAKLGR